jgi:hypothetical protein
MADQIMSHHIRWCDCTGEYSMTWCGVVYWRLIVTWLGLSCPAPYDIVPRHVISFTHHVWVTCSIWMQSVDACSLTECLAQECAYLVERIFEDDPCSQLLDQDTADKQQYDMTRGESDVTSSNKAWHDMTWDDRRGGESDVEIKWQKYIAITKNMAYPFDARVVSSSAPDSPTHILGIQCALLIAVKTASTWL